MITVFFGQPNSGKTILARKYSLELCINDPYIKLDKIDGDCIRALFVNGDYSKEGRIKNINRISDIAYYLQCTLMNEVVVSAVYPYKECRDYLNILNKNTPFSEPILWVYLYHTDIRERDNYAVADFDTIEDNHQIPNLIKLNTTEHGIEECIKKVLSFRRSLSNRT
jgi:adenylylsulfate kinase-like enzyme